MFGAIASSYDFTNTVLSLGMHHWWKYLAVREASGSQLVIDLATGTGDLVKLLKRRIPRVIGVDFCLPMLQVAEQRFGEAEGCEFVQGDALNMPVQSDVADCVTIAFGVRNFEDLEAGLREILRVVKRGGRIVVLEFGQPRWTPFAAIYRWYSRRIMPLIGGWLSGERQAYEYLPNTAAQFPCGADFAEILRRVGFKPTLVKSLTGGIAFIYVAEKP